MIATKNPTTYLLSWPCLNMFVMAIAYFLNKPSLILGKKKNGETNFLLLLINFPWLLFTWSIFKIQITFSKEEFANNIDGTKLWISRKPITNDNISEFHNVLDLTCEFYKDKISKNYYCFPNLDGHILKTMPDLTNINLKEKTLIHCANGHGRTALFTSLLLVETGIVENTDLALNKILQSRPLAKPNKAQRKWLLTRRLARSATSVR